MCRCHLPIHSGRYWSASATGSSVDVVMILSSAGSITPLTETQPFVHGVMHNTITTLQIKFDQLLRWLVEMLSREWSTHNGRPCITIMIHAHVTFTKCNVKVKKGKVFPYSLPSVGPGADPGVQAVSPQVTWSESRHLLSSSLPLFSAGPAVTPVAFTRWRYL